MCMMCELPWRPGLVPVGAADQVVHNMLSVVSHAHGRETGLRSYFGLVQDAK